MDLTYYIKRRSNHTIRYKVVLILFWYILFFNGIGAQIKTITQIEKPSTQAVEITKYGKYAPNLYSGTLSFSIPVYTYKDRDFEIPVSLDYNYTGFKPNIPASEIGIGWVLNAGGCITREVRGMPDEEINANVKTGYRSTDIMVQGFDNITNYASLPNAVNIIPSLLEETNSGTLIKFYKTLSGINYEYTPDIYHFSFLGRTGTFSRDSTGRFKVYNTNSANGEYVIEKTNYTVIEENVTNYPPVISSIIKITTGDGYIYYFGEWGENNEKNFYETDRNAIKVSQGGNTEDDKIRASTILSWKLSKIESPSGRCIFFNYGEKNGGHVTASYSPYSWIFNYGTSWSGTGAQQMEAKERLVRGAELESISTQTEEIFTFNYADKGADVSGQYINGTTIANIPLNRTNKLLKEIYFSNTVCRLYYKFNRTGNPYPFLSKAYIQGIGSYDMEYSNIADEYYPPLGTVATDHWGYYNSTDRAKSNTNTVPLSSICSLGTDYSETLSNYKNKSAVTTRYGAINKITYPYKGYTTFEYEPNYYSKQILRSPSSAYNPAIATTATTEGPGLRIKKITNHLSDNTIAAYQSYEYKNADNSCSGTLLSSPRYGVKYAGTYINSTIAMQFGTSEPMYGYENVPVEYSRVVETASDTSKTAYIFSNYSTIPDNICNSSYYTINYITSIGGTDASGTILISPNPNYIYNLFTPSITRQAQRGKLTGKSIYKKESDNPLQSIAYTYNAQNHILSTQSDFMQTGSGYRLLTRYTDDYRLTSSTTTDYYGSLYVAQNHAWEYNNTGQKSKESRIESNGDIYSTYYTYIPDITNKTAVQQAMLDHNVINFPIESYTTIKKNGTGSETIISKDKYTFAEYNNSNASSQNNTKFYKPVKWEKLNTVSGALYTFAEYKYDSHGNVTEQKDADGIYTSYIWGQDGMGIILQIVNASNSAIKGISSSMSNIFDNPPAKGSISATANTIKNALPNCEIEQYEYLKYSMPDKITAPSGKYTKYEYDSSDRLIRVIDEKNNTVEEYTYNTVSK